MSEEGTRYTAEHFTGSQNFITDGLNTLKDSKFAKKILENDTYDGSANFISGMIFRRLGKLNQAEEAFSVAARTMEYRSAAYLQIAGLKMQKEDFSGAVEYAKKALDFNRYNIPAYELLATGYRKLNNHPESEQHPE